MGKIQDFGARTGVLVSGASCVLNGREARMQPETLVRVQKAIEELGFQPNQPARMLKTGHMPMIGLMVSTVANPFSACWCEGSRPAPGNVATDCCNATPTATRRTIANTPSADGPRGARCRPGLGARGP